MILVGDVKDKTCIIIDDMSDTCGTLCKAADVLKQSGAKRVIGIVTHGVMSGAALDKVRESPSLELKESLKGSLNESLKKSLKIAQRESLNESFKEPKLKREHLFEHLSCSSLYLPSTL